MIQAATYTSEAELRANAKAIRQRLMFGGRKTAADNQNAPAVKREAEPRDLVSFPAYRPFKGRKTPAWKVEETHFNHHETTWERWKEEVLATNGSPIRAYVRRRAEELGIPFADLVGPRQSRRYARPRQLVMWEIKTIVKPHISLPEIGRIFGGRDHTTVLHAVRKIQGMKERGEI